MKAVPSTFQKPVLGKLAPHVHSPTCREQRACAPAGVKSTWPHTCEEPAFCPSHTGMAGSQLPPPLLLLVLVLLLGNFSSQTPPERQTPPSSPAPAPQVQGWRPPSRNQKQSPPPSSGSPSSELTTTSHSPNSTTLTLHWSSSSPSPRTEPPSMPSNTTDGTSVATGPAPGDTGAPELHRNPGVVVAMCLLVSVLLLGAVLMAVRCHHWGVSKS
ncbi:unnamed protein product [Nyctereutes procyonoides]|uniref:(raccoon dog) hypothetical protein n=1 Tax=Nyctereutes procyonoides TaxID=34880 RepID=A0A811Z9F7_NYCPR|nr:unnamed protein product [Nyctereutes procyonoides]